LESFAADPVSNTYKRAAETSEAATAATAVSGQICRVPMAFDLGTERKYERSVHGRRANIKIGCT